MRIAIDALPLQIARTGPKTFLEELCRTLPQVAPEHEFIQLAPKRPFRMSRSLLGKITFHIRFYIWKEIQLPWYAWQHRCDFIFCSDFVVPFFSPCPTIPVLFDADIWKNKTNHNRLWRFVWSRLSLLAARKSPFILTISHASKKDIVAYTGLPSERVKVLHLAPKHITEHRLKAAEIASVLEPHGITADMPFILHVGVLAKRKNLLRLIKAFAQAKPHIDQAYRLVLVGQPGPQKTSDDYDNICQFITKNHLHETIILTNYVPDEHLPAFYQQATLYAFPSLHEGFGLPILEAFANNVPVMASDATSIPEIAGEAALLFNPYSVQEIQDAIIQLANDPKRQTEMTQRGKKRLSQFGWEKTARKFVRFLESTLSASHLNTETQETVYKSHIERPE